MNGDSESAIFRPSPFCMLSVSTPKEEGSEDSRSDSERFGEAEHDSEDDGGVQNEDVNQTVRAQIAVPKSAFARRASLPLRSPVNDKLHNCLSLPILSTNRLEPPKSKSPESTSGAEKSLPPPLVFVSQPVLNTLLSSPVAISPSATPQGSSQDIVRKLSQTTGQQVSNIRFERYPFGRSAASGDAHEDDDALGPFRGSLSFSESDNQSILRSSSLPDQDELVTSYSNLPPALLGENASSSEDEGPSRIFAESQFAKGLPSSGLGYEDSFQGVHFQNLIQTVESEPYMDTAGDTRALVRPAEMNRSKAFILPSPVANKERASAVGGFASKTPFGTQQAHGDTEKSTHAPRLILHEKDEIPDSELNGGTRRSASGGTPGYSVEKSILSVSDLSPVTPDPSFGGVTEHLPRVVSGKMSRTDSVASSASNDVSDTKGKLRRKRLTSRFNRLIRGSNSANTMGSSTTDGTGDASTDCGSDAESPKVLPSGRRRSGLETTLERIGSGGSGAPFWVNSGSGGSAEKLPSFKESPGSSYDGKAEMPQSNALILHQVVRQAMVGKCRFSDVLDAMLEVSCRLESYIVDSLYKYLSLPASVELIVSYLRRETAPANHDGLKGINSDDIRLSHNPYHYVLVNALVSGQPQVRRALLTHVRSRGELCAYFEEEAETSFKFNSAQREIRVHGMGRVLSALLHEGPAEMTEFVAARKGFIHKLVQNHISVSSVSDFVMELCAANPLSSVDNDELRYGAPNAAGMILLAKENVCGILSELFESCTDDVSLGGMTTECKRAREEACLHCILELSKRTLVIPLYDKSNCSYGGRYIKHLNMSLSRLSVFHDTSHIGRILHNSLKALFGMPGDRGVALVNTLETITQLLNIVAAGSSSKLASTRMNMRRTPTKALEDVVLEHREILSKLVMLEPGKQGSLQRLRLTIIELFKSLMASKNASTLEAVAGSDVTVNLFQLVSTMEWSSLMQSKVAQCIEIAFGDATQREGVLRLQESWMAALDEGCHLWQVLLPSTRCGEQRAATEEIGYYGAYIRIALALRTFAEKDGGHRLASLMTRAGSYGRFETARVQLLDRVAEERRKPLAGPLPDRTTVSLLASATSLAALSLDNIDAV